MEVIRSFIEYISDLNSVSIVVRLFMATVCGGIIGLERGRKGQAAGGRTHMLVCIGSALVMMTNIYVVENYSPDSDPTRIAAQVVSGIGFLGAGSILVTSKNQIRGLTTAAGLWASGCMGLTIGIGFYELAIIGCMFIFAIVALLNKFDIKGYGKSKLMEVYVEFEEPRDLKNIINYASEKDMNVKHIQIVKNKGIDHVHIAALFTIKSIVAFDHVEVITDISELKGICSIEEL